MALFTRWDVKNGTLGKDITDKFISAQNMPALRRLGPVAWARSTSKAPGLTPSDALPCVVMEWGGESRPTILFPSLRSGC